MPVFAGLLSSWDTGGVEDFTSFCEGATKFDGDVSGWDMKNARSLVSMFKGAVAFNRDLNQWEVDNVLDMTNTFSGASSFNQLLCWELNDEVLLSGIFDESQACFDPACARESLVEQYSCEDTGHGSSDSNNSTQSDQGVDNGMVTVSLSDEESSGPNSAKISPCTAWSSSLLMLTASWLLALL